MPEAFSHSGKPRHELGLLEFFILMFLSVCLLLTLSIRQFDQPDVETTLIRMYKGYSFFRNVFEFSGLSNCTVTLSCSPGLYEFFLFRQIVFLSIIIISIFLSIFFYKSNFKVVCLILSVSFPSSLYFLTNFTNEVGAYGIALLLPFIALPWKLISLVIAFQIDVGNTIVLVLYLVVDWLFPRRIFWSIVFFASGLFSHELLEIIFGFVSGGKLFDVLNYILNVTYGELLPYVFYYPISVLSLLLMTPLKVGAVSSLAALSYLTLVLLSKGSMRSFLRNVLTSSEIQTVILVVALLPAYGYGKYFLFVIPMLVAMVLRHANVRHLLAMNSIIIFGFSLETLILEI